MTKYIQPPRSEECEWRSGPPPEIGWWPADNYICPDTGKPDKTELLRYYDGQWWSFSVGHSECSWYAGKVAMHQAMHQDDMLWTDRWWLK